MKCKLIPSRKMKEEYKLWHLRLGIGILAREQECCRDPRWCCRGIGGPRREGGEIFGRAPLLRGDIVFRLELPQQGRGAVATVDILPCGLTILWKNQKNFYAFSINETLSFASFHLCIPRGKNKGSPEELRRGPTDKGILYQGLSWSPEVYDDQVPCHVSHFQLVEKAVSVDGIRDV